MRHRHRPRGSANAVRDRSHPSDLQTFQVIPATAYVFGNSGRNILDGPGFIALNSAVSRRIFVNERTSLQIRWEVFNLTNHPNFTIPNVDVDTNSAGTITSAGNGREMQFGLRVAF
jgi:hypothetical protein